ncbi:Uncharacterised protein [Bordetella pertussis]|nr:Uncharacterised protein [Bordetella pertussis]
MNFLARYSPMATASMSFCSANENTFGRGFSPVFSPG